MVSVVIPTFKRFESLTRLIDSINRQSLDPNEIIVVASGYDKKQLNNIKSLNQSIVIIESSPSVCKQRNIGIIRSACDYVLLCDDDIILPENYIETVWNYSENNNNVKIVTGCEFRRNELGQWKEIQYPTSLFSLLHAYIFGLGICTNISKLKPNKNIPSSFLLNFYLNKGNHITKAGWPILTNFDFPIMTTTIYSLQCALIKKDELIINLFDEQLDPNGIGDNYEVALKINKLRDKIHVLRNLPYKHFKENTNRYSKHVNYEKRCNALNMFLQTLPYFSLRNRFYFIWSLVGNGVRFLIKKEFNLFKSNQKVLYKALIHLLKY